MIRDLGLPDHNGQTIVLFADEAPKGFWGKDLGIGATEGVPHQTEEVSHLAPLGKES